MSESLTTVQIEVIQSKSKLKQPRARKKVPHQQTPDQIDVAVNDLFFADPEVQSIQAQIHKAEGNLKEVTRLARGSDPSVARGLDPRQELNATRDALWKKLEPELRRQVIAARADRDIDQQIKDAENELSAQTVMQDELQTRLDAANLITKNAESEQVRLGFAKADLQRPRAW